MEPWLKVSCILCVFGFVRELRPSEPYHTEFLLGDTFNVTQDQLNRDVYPIATYSYLALLIVVFLVTDFLRYKPVIIANAITGTFIWGLLLFCSTVWSLQIVEVFYGFYQAAEVAYYSYIYAKVDKKYYPIVTSHTRAAMFAGKLVAGLSAQALIMWKLMNYRGLVYISMASQVLAMCWAFFLPRVQLSLYFHQKTPQASNELQGHVNMAVSETTAPSEASLSKGSESTAKSSIQPLQLLWLHFRSAYTNPMVVQWSLWYAVALAGYLQATSYIQVLWKSFENEPSIVWNGAVDAAFTALAAGFALMAGYLHAGRLKSRTSLIALAVFALLEGGCILLACWPKNIYLSYVGYTLFGGLFGFTITVASAELAQSLVEDSFALIFGINTLVALILQTVLTLLVISGLQLGPIEQFVVYGFYFIAIGSIFFIVVAIQYVLGVKRNTNTHKIEVEG
ncbi:thiamine transporter 2-like isoform X2 [Scaptodrosophila lebanonensis]|uniref:Thiamine transporter 2-like isoform X2 n=1 Tax=Drosophila lebanonensis TaxID=7225 RepID=A0A6J2TDE3_DROLE|nr:thiamine transporter 2-like isoform X2 [Scaptodrosophila lebanonensis]